MHLTQQRRLDGRRQNGAVDPRFELPIGVASVVGVVILVIGIARRRPSGDIDGDLNVIPLGSALLTGIFMSWAGLVVLARSAVMGILILSLSAVAIILAAKMAMASRSSSDRGQTEGELSRPAEDYLVWTALGMPMLIVAILVVLAILGRLDAS